MDSGGGAVKNILKLYVVSIGQTHEDDTWAGTTPGPDLALLSKAAEQQGHDGGTVCDKRDFDQWDLRQIVEKWATMIS